MSDDQTAKAGEGTPPVNKADEGTATSKSFTQEELNAIIAREKRDWEKANKPLVEKARQYEDLAAKQKEKEDAEKSELQKLADENAALKSQAERAKALEERFNALLEAKLQAIPEEKRSLVPEGLAAETTLEWIEKNHAFLFGKEGGAGIPTSGKPGQADIDPYRKKADDLTTEYLKLNPHHPANKDTAQREMIVKRNIDLLKSRGWTAP